MERPRNTIFIVIVIFAIAIFAGLNVAMGRLGGGQHSENEAATEAASSEKTASQQPPPPAATPVRLPTDETSGPPNPNLKVVVGWTWTPELQGNPQALQNTIESIKKAAPGAQVRVVNVDAVPDAPTGIQVNGQKAMELPENGIIEAAQAAEAVAKAASSATK